MQKHYDIIAEDKSQIGGDDSQAKCLYFTGARIFQSYIVFPEAKMILWSVGF